MEDLLLSLVAHLTSGGIVIGDGEDTFRDMMPDTCDYPTTIALVEYGGTPFSDASLMRRNIQISVRSNSYTVAKTKCWEIYSALHNPEDPLVLYDSVVECLMGEATSTPVKLKVDQLSRTTWVFNYAVLTNNKM